MLGHFQKILFLKTCVLITMDKHSTEEHQQHIYRYNENFINYLSCLFASFAKDIQLKREPNNCHDMVSEISKYCRIVYIFVVFFKTVEQLKITFKSVLK